MDSAVVVLPGAGFSDESQRFALIERQIDAVDGIDRFRVGTIDDAKVGNFQQGFFFHCLFHSVFSFHQVLSRGSIASRRPSPSRLKERAVIMMKMPGIMIRCGTVRMTSRASASIEPHSGFGGCTPMPI